MDISENVILDIESITLPPNKCPGSPKMTKALSRKGCCRMERKSVEEQEVDDSSKKLVVKVLCSQQEQLKQPFVPNKTTSAMPAMANSTNPADAGDGKVKRFKRLTTINPRRILLLFASLFLQATTEEFSVVKTTRCRLQSIGVAPRNFEFLRNGVPAAKRDDMPPAQVGRAWGA